MCRYAFCGPYKSHFACLSCRKMFRPRLSKDVGEDQSRNYLCPQCGQAMVNVGLDFKAPKQRDRESWQVVAVLSQFNIGYGSCGCGTGYRPERLRDLPAFLGQSSWDAPEQFDKPARPRRRTRASRYSPPRSWRLPR